LTSSDSGAASTISSQPAKPSRSSTASRRPAAPLASSALQRPFARNLDVADVAFIPISALHGDNVVDRSEAMGWYGGLPLLEHLETVEIASDRNLDELRFPVQYVIRDHATDYRGYAGRLTGGVVRPGDEVLVLPSGRTTTVVAVDTYDGPLDEAFPPLSVTLRLADDLDISRGDLISKPENAPTATQDLDALVCWMTDEPLRPRRRIAVKHTTRTARAMVKELAYRLDVNTLHRDREATELGLNDIGRVRLRVTQPLFVDDYTRNRVTGRFILVDEATNATVGAGMLTPAG
jgi:bifunctional enzyme CysN/CysC